MILLDGSAMTTRDGLWDEIAKALDAPEYFGRNLDALHDILTEMNGQVRLTHACHMINALGSYGCRVLEVFFDAANENPRFTFTVGGHENRGACE